MVYRYNPAPKSKIQNSFKFKSPKALSVFPLVKISYAQRDFSTALSGKDVAGFYAAVRKFVVIIIVAAPLFSFNGWVEDRLVLAWRAYLTRRLTRAYFANRAFYHIQQRGDCMAAAPASSCPGTAATGGGAATAAVVAASPASGALGGGGIDNPDQRICDDVGSFVRSSVSLSLTLCRKIFSCVAFAGVLWGVSGSLVLFMFMYATVGTFVTTAMFGRVLTTLFYRQLAREADLRFSLVRVRENAESIAFYRGEGGERVRVLSRLDAVLAVIADRVRWSALYDLWTSVYSYATILVPSLLTAPRYFAGEIEFGVISQASFAFSRIDAALSIIINNLAQISGLAAETERLDSLIAAMGGPGSAASDAGRVLEEGDDAGRKGSRGSAAAAAAAAVASLLLSSPGGGDVIRRRTDRDLRGLVLQNVTVVTPRGAGGAGGVAAAKLLASDLTFTLEPGQSLLVVGASGCGKSSLLRAIAGLWTTGSGVVVLPGGGRGGGGDSSCAGATRGSVFFLPQKPFMPLGDLRTQLTFPSAVTAGIDVILMQGNGDPWVTAASTTTQPTTATTSSSGGGVRQGNHEDMSQPDDEGHLERAPLLESGSGARGGGEGVQALSDEELLALLDDVGGLDVELDWSSVLSVGEQQRVAVLRLLAAKPCLAFLDEATSALDGPTEGRLYGLIRKRIGCYVSVGHRMQLLQHHTHVLECLGSGTWRMDTSEQYQRRMAAATGLHL
ncbi:hypothetical protein VOLCADRAFT_96169 [Volvox carteri f. nagariensis]|uniref:ABC transporter domain-containing protein n=1 Tax=Volvox carteri f. nagariensis TaxID=3068 RepID=D8U9E2_VOLCA|nr:uncharacterized protein VOLCADRAFT_96169 [Volvox carteri f. nagariensis]EFJ43625.1 hypothetical protein VOLCADRAFT_96169 [Volvox carteri f. nagariensis]|eukprot:XP_002955325.1 hypothetical protein VOLCADRAFT_96169 [Volvox carteri f. nagariensis]